tara:strand:+ start:870 stop:2369 length:1500 start_codon:yes stop_codon:yes gene_type:complete
MESKTQTDSCSVCWNKYNKSTRKKVSCNFCDLECCRECIRAYLLQTTELPHCMECKNKWELDFTKEAVLSSYLDKTYKQHRKNILFELEKARIPQTIPKAEKTKRVRELDADIKETNKELRDLREKMQILEHKNYNIRQEKYRLLSRAQNDKREFKQACGVEGCKGFLSSQWKCGICNNWTCPKCFVILGPDKECGHECKEDDVKTAELIKKETRNCPGCATPIFRVSGCDQMWCTQCHIAFSWQTGRKVTGTIHNPHFYQWQREGGQAPIQNPGNIACGGLPNNHYYISNLYKVLLCNYGITPYRINANLLPQSIRKSIRTATKFHRLAEHFHHMVLNRLRVECANVRNNDELRIKYILNELDEEGMKKILIRRDKLYNKKLATLQIYELIGTIITESVQDISQTADEILAAYRRNQNNLGEQEKEKMRQVIIKNANRFTSVREYANNELLKVGLLYKQTVKIIDETFNMLSVKPKKSDLQKNVIITTAAAGETKTAV